MKFLFWEIKGKRKIVCPKCKIKIKYDCSQDAYVVNKSFSSEQEVSVKDTTGIKTLILSYCICGKVLGISVKDDDGMELYEHPEIDGNEILV